MKNCEPFVPGPALAIDSLPGASWRKLASTLDHEVGNNPVKIEAIVEAALSQVDKVGDGHRCLVCEQIDLDGSFTGFDGCDQRHKKFSKLEWETKINWPFMLHLSEIRSVNCMKTF